MELIYTIFHHNLQVLKQNAFWKKEAGHCFTLWTKLKEHVSDISHSNGNFISTSGMVGNRRQITDLNWRFRKLCNRGDFNPNQIEKRTERILS
jgi:hypothetical protein